MQAQGNFVNCSMACTSTGITPSYQKSPDFIVLRLLVEESDTQISSDIQFSMSGDWLHTGAQPQPQGMYSSMYGYVSDVAL